VSTEPDFRVLTTNLLAKNEKEGEKDSKQEKLITFLGQELTRQKSFSEQAEMKMREDEKHIRELLAQNVAIRRQLEEALEDKGFVSQEHAALLSETNEAQHALQIALQEKTQFERDILRLQSQLSDAETSAHSLQRQLSLAHSNLDELKAEIEDLRATATAAGLTEEELPERRQLHRTVPIKRLITGQVALNVNTDFLEGLSLEQQIRLSQEEYVTPEKDEPLQLISVS
jgi:chromosome segregation ATPase